MHLSSTTLITLASAVSFHVLGVSATVVTDDCGTDPTPPTNLNVSASCVSAADSCSAKMQDGLPAPTMLTFCKVCIPPKDSWVHCDDARLGVLPGLDVLVLGFAEPGSPSLVYRSADQHHRGLQHHRRSQPASRDWTRMPIRHSKRRSYAYVLPCRPV